MISTSVKFSGNPVAGLGLGSDAFFRQVQMQRLGEFALKTVVARARKGIGSDDSAMPPLKGANVRVFAGRVNGVATFKSVGGYAAWKSKHGLQPIRDLWALGKGGHARQSQRPFGFRDQRQDGLHVAFGAHQGARKREADAFLLVQR